MSPGESSFGVCQADAVQVGAVGGADVLDPDAVAPGLHARVVRRGVLVPGEVDVVAGAAPEQERRRVEEQLVVLVERRALDDDQAAALDLRLLAEPGTEPGASTKLSWGMRTSRAAERTIRQMKR